MRIIDVKYELGPEDAGLSEDEIARKVGDMCIEVEEAFDFILKRKWESIDEEDKTEKEDDRSYLREIQSKVTRRRQGGLKKMVKDSEETRRNSRNNQEET